MNRPSTHPPASPPEQIHRTRHRELVQVEWIDSASSDAWLPLPEAEKQLQLGRIWTIGWSVHEDADRLVLAGSHSADWEQVGDVIAIPKAMIRTMLHLRDMPEEAEEADRQGLPLSAERVEFPAVAR